MQARLRRAVESLPPPARALAGLALVATLSGGLAAVLGYAALRTLQDILGIPELTPTLLAVVGAVLGCRLAFRIVPPDWL